MPFLASAISVKIECPLGSVPDAPQLRRLELTGGVATRLEDLRDLLEERIGASVPSRFAYRDDEGDDITITCNAELRAALTSGVRRLRLVASPPDVAWRGGGASSVCEADDGWQLVEQPRMEIVWSSSLRLWVNGEECLIENPSPSVTLLDWLRDVRGMTGTHVGCHDGGCGICTIMLAHFDRTDGEIKSMPINSCLRRLCGCDGYHVLTTEGIGSKTRGLHAVQEALSKGNGSQCGFCTPGWVMQMYALLERNASPSREDVERHFDGNLCRCTGYRPILTAMGTLAEGGSRCGQHQCVPHPAALLKHEAQPLRFVDAAGRQEWYRPVTMDQLFAAAACAKGKDLRFICAGTGAGVAKYYETPETPENRKQTTVLVDISLLQELRLPPHASPSEFSCGSAISLASLIDALEAESVNSKISSLGVLAAHMRRIASVQIRSVASWAGNLMLARAFPKFPSDLATILTAAGAKVDVLNLDDPSAPSMDLNVPQLLAVGGRPLLRSLRIPITPPGAIFLTFKASQRNVFAHAIVNLGAYIAFDDRHQVSAARIVAGGATKSLLEGKETANALLGQRLEQATFESAATILINEVRANASSDLRQPASYREQLTTGFLYKVFLAAQESLQPRLRSALVPLAPAASRPLSRGTEAFGTDPAERPISSYVPKRSSDIQASGEALYASDYGGSDTLFGQPVFSRQANAKLIALDPSEALKSPGVRDFIAAPAVPGPNCIQPGASGDNLKEKIFFEIGDVVPCAGAPLGLVVADTWRQARDAAALVMQHYAAIDSGAVATSLQDARRLRRIHPVIKDVNTSSHHHGRRGVRPEFAAGVDFVAPGIARGRCAADGFAKGALRTGGQTHFYMETQSVCVTPHDGDRWEVVISDQDCNLTQQSVALILGVPMHHVNVKMPRAGGGFGGKLSRQLLSASAAAVAAHHLKRAVRIQLERSDDNHLCGGREPMDFEYEVSFESSGKVKTLSMDMTMDGGWFYGDVGSDMNMAVGWSDNCYCYEQFHVKAHAGTTDTHHTTSMRAPGCMQSLLCAESIMERVAREVQKPLKEVQEMNFYKLSDAPVTPFGDKIGQNGFNWTIPTLWSQLQEQADYAKRSVDIAAFNHENRWRKRGLALSPVKYVMDISATNYRSGALVNIYSDGTVLVSSGGSEIGQGLSTKVALCAASALDAPLDKVVVGPRETSKVPDGSSTGGSGTSETSAQAASIACEKLAALLRPYRKPGVSWDAAVTAALADNVGLMASAWFEYRNTGNTNSYATYGTAASEVEIDVLTGEVRVNRVDILMDLGTQLDAAVDIGQLQGGFVIAMGYLLSEEKCVDPASGRQLNVGTWEYKIPSAYDIPLEFNVSLLRDSPNPVGIKGSKASAEPAMCLIPSVYLALKEALYAARQEVGLGSSWFQLDVPCTPAAVRAAAGVPMSQMQVE